VWLAMIAWNGYLKTWQITRLFWASVRRRGRHGQQVLRAVPVPVLPCSSQSGGGSSAAGAAVDEKTGSFNGHDSRHDSDFDRVSYWKETWALTFDKTASVPLTSKIDGGGASIRLLRTAGHLLSLPPTLPRGARMQMQHAADGHDSYVLGRRDPRGVWYYFPVAFAVKTPTTVLILMLIALAGARPRCRGSLPGTGSADFATRDSSGSF